MTESGGILKGITFGEYHSYEDFHLILNSKEIASPAVKVKKLEIEGADSDLDYTDYFGGAKYENATHKFFFSTMVPQTSFLSLYSTIKNALHGKKMRIILDDDPSFYYMGRIHVSPLTTERNIGVLSMECDCEPYKYKLNKTVVTATVADSATVTLPNSRKKVVPEVLIETDSSIRIEYQGSNVWDLGSGSYTLPELELVEGDNIVTITGTGTVTFTYQEGMM